MKTINLYAEDGIAIYLDNDTDIVPAADATVKVIGHRLYTCSAEEADQIIRREYLKRAGIADPLAQ